MRTLLAGLLLFSAAAWAAAGDAPGSAIDRILDRVPAGGRVGVALFAADGTPLLERGSGRPLAIASLTKLFVSAAALTRLGRDHVFTTRLVGLGPLGADGSLPGLGVIASGDPCLDEHFTDRQPDRAFLAWAEALKAAGVRRIDGDLVIDASAFAGPIRPETYPDSEANVQQWFNAPASALAFNDNCIEVRVLPTAPGQAAEVQVRPRSARITVVNRTRTVATVAKPKLIATRSVTSNTVTVSGDYDRPTDWFPMAIHRDPDLLAGDHLRALLADAGIPVTGEVRLAGVDPKAGPELHVCRNPLLPALAILNQRSQNFYGEQILRVLGRETGAAGSVTDGAAAVASALRALGLEGDDWTILDGSGLSYGNRASASALCRLLSRMQAHALGADYLSTLKEDRRLPRGLVKTGTLAIAACLAGYLNGPPGARPCFAIVINRGEARSFDWAPALRDDLLAALARLQPQP